MTQSSLAHTKSHLLQMRMYTGLAIAASQAAAAMPLLSMLACGLPLLAYGCTLAPTVQTFDSAELTTGSYVLGIVHAPGYPLYLALGKLFTFLPIGNVAYRMNLMSGVFAAATSLMTFWLLVHFTKHRVISLAATLTLAFSVYFWQEAVVAEAYTLETLMIASFLLVLLRWRAAKSGSKMLVLLAFLFGLSLGNRTTTLLFLPGLALYVLAETKGRILREYKSLTFMFAAFLLGLSIYLYLPIRYLADPPLNYASDQLYGVDLTTPGGLWWMISGQMYHFYAFGYSLIEAVQELTSYLGQLWRNFLGVGALVGIVGWIRMWRDGRRRFMLVFLPFLLNVVFFVNYRVVDKDTMFLPTYLLWTVALAYGYVWIIDACRGWSHHFRLEKLRISPASAVVAVAVSIGLLGGILNWRWADHSKDMYTEVFARQYLSRVPPNALVVADWSAAVVLEYFQLVEGDRPDVVVLNRSRFGVARYYYYWSLGFDHEEILELIAQQERDSVGRYPAELVVCLDDPSVSAMPVSLCSSPDEQSPMPP
jgi:hypothetical protein